MKIEELRIKKPVRIMRNVKQGFKAPDPSLIEKLLLGENEGDEE